MLQRLWAEGASDVSVGEWAAALPPWVPSQGLCGRWDCRAPFPFLSHSPVPCLVSQAPAGRRLGQWN